jgi:hypothetical protein
MAFNLSTFDPQAFLDMPVDVAFERRNPLPAKDYPAQINDVQARPWQSKDKYNNDGTLKSGLAYDITLSVQIPLDVKEACGLKTDTLTLKDSIMLDLNENGGLATEKGTNNQLRAYREALDMNKPGVTFRAREMTGRMLLVRIKHEEYQGNIQERVGGVARLA